MGTEKTPEKLQENWDSYEATDPGFAMVQDLLARTRDLIKSTLHVPRGYEYRTGSFKGLITADFLTSFQANANYAQNTQNQKEFTKAWDSINAEYKRDQKRLAAAAAKKQAQEDGLWGLVTDVLQTVAGAVITAAGLGLTPFTGGLSLGLVGLGGMMVIGGVNSGINHFSMAVSGKGLNLVGMATKNVGQWYNSTLGKSLGDTGDGGRLNGFIRGAGEMVSGMAQFNVASTAEGVYTLATNGEARAQFGAGVGNWWNQLAGGNAVVQGETAAFAASFFVGGGSATIGKAGDATSLVTKLGNVKTLAAGKAFNLVDNLSGKMSEFRAVVSSGGARYAFAGAGDSRSILSVAGKTADDLPKTGVKMAFSNLESKASKANGKLDDLASKGSSELRLQDGDTFSAKLRGDTKTIEGLTVKDFDYVKRNPQEVGQLRKEFDSSARKNYLKILSKNDDYLRQNGLSDLDIKMMKNGRVPRGYQVHHNHPLDDSGTNDFDNLILIKNDPYHKLITNYQKETVGSLEVGQTKTIPWPELTNKVFNGGVR
ncbi:HNH endonuclease family protein [Lactovum odontotermitis]